MNGETPKGKISKARSLLDFGNWSFGFCAEDAR